MTTDANKQVAIPSGNGMPAVVGSRDELDAFGDLTPDEMVLPQMKLTQGVSRPPMDSQMAGNFWNTVTKDYKAGLVVAILAMTRSRSFFGASFDDPPLCASDDAVRPRERVRITTRSDEVGTVTGPTCAECAFAQWGTAKGGEGKGQACQMAYNLLCLDLGDHSIYVLRVTGAAILDFRKYFTAGKMSRIPAYAVETVIGSEERVFDAGRAYMPTFTTGDRLAPEITQACREQAARYRGVSLGVEGDVEVLTREEDGDDAFGDIAPEEIVQDEIPVREVRESGIPDGETHMTTCAVFNGKACDCDAETHAEPPQQAEGPRAAPVAAQSSEAATTGTVEPEEIPFETADDFPPNPPMITDAQKDYLIGGGKIKNTDSLCSKWVKHRGGSKPIIADIENLDPAIAAGVVFNEKAQILNWRIIILTEEQATAMIAALKKELGIGTRKKKEPVG